MHNLRDPLADMTIIITGAGSGIGRETAILLAARGASVVLAGRRQERIAAVAESIRADGGRAVAVATDVTVPEDLHTLVDRAVSEFGGVDVLVNNAGIARLGRIDQLPVTDWSDMIDSNITSLLNGLAAVVPVFQRQGHGHVVTIASTAGITISPTMGVYAATKNAARTIMEALRTESTDGVIRTTEISPGFVRTELADTMDSASRDIIQAGMRTFGLDPVAVAHAVAFAIEQPHDVEIGSLTIRPTIQN